MELLQSNSLCHKTHFFLSNTDLICFGHQAEQRPVKKVKYKREREKEREEVVKQVGENVISN